jgi:hypothetical protein
MMVGVRAGAEVTAFPSARFLFAYDRWETPRSVLDRDLVRGVGTDLLRAIVNDNRGDRLRSDRVEQTVAEQEAKRFAREEQDKLDAS